MGAQHSDRSQGTPGTLSLYRCGNGPEKSLPYGPGLPFLGAFPSPSLIHLLSLLAASFFSKGQRVKGVDTPSLWDSRTFFGQPRHPSSSFRVFIWDMGTHRNSITPTAIQESRGERALELQLDPSSHLLLRTQVGRGDEE